MKINMLSGTKNSDFYTDMVVGFAKELIVEYYIEDDLHEAALDYFLIHKDGANILIDHVWKKHNLTATYFELVCDDITLSAGFDFAEDEHFTKMCLAA